MSSRNNIALPFHLSSQPTCVPAATKNGGGGGEGGSGGYKSGDKDGVEVGGGEVTKAMTRTLQSAIYLSYATSSRLICTSRWKCGQTAQTSHVPLITSPLGWLADVVCLGHGCKSTLLKLSNSPSRSSHPPPPIPPSPPPPTPLPKQTRRNKLIIENFVLNHHFDFTFIFWSEFREYSSVYRWSTLASSISIRSPKVLWSTRLLSRTITVEQSTLLRQLTLSNTLLP